MDNNGKTVKTTLSLSAEAQDLSGYVADGWQIHYAPVSGGVGAWNPKPEKDKEDWFAPSVGAFLELRAAGIIRHSSTMRHGHRRFHGLVDIYTGTHGSSIQETRFPGMHRWSRVGGECLDCGESFWSTKPCPGFSL